MNFKKYSKYKDSGVDWIGEIPEHWNIKRLKFSILLRSDKSNYSNSLQYVGLENITSKTGKLIDVNDDMSDSDAKLFEEKDILFGKLRPYLAKVWHAEFAGRCSSEFLVFKGIDYESKFLSWLLLSDGVINNIDASTYGAKMPRAEWCFIGNIILPILSINEQKQIAEFLDKQTLKINSDIQKNQKLIELLKEKRESTINQAVTKGLDPTVPMKDSGIEWIGEIPEEWEIKKIGKIATSFVPGRYKPEIFDGEIPWITIPDMDSGFIKKSRKNLGLSVDEIRKIGTKIIPKNSIIMSCVGDVGITAITDNDIVINQQLHGFLVNDFMNSYYVAKSIHIQKDFLKNSANTTVVTYMNKEKCESILIPIPPLQDQIKISQFIKIETSKIDSLITKTESQIEKLQEFRQSLIASAVTGKIDVRSA